MWDVIVSVPDHCLSFLLSEQNIWRISWARILISGVQFGYMI